MKDVAVELDELRRAVAGLEAERECAGLLARYGYYADHGRREDWIDLWTEDGVLDGITHVSGDPTDPDPANWRRMRYEGHEQLRIPINSAAQDRIEGRSQHRMGGLPATFRLADDHNAIMVTYSTVFFKESADFTPVVDHQNLSMNRWTFRKVDGTWLIAGCIRRKMGHPETASLVEDF